MLYSMGLDLDAILPRATRTRATLVVAVVATGFVFLGHFAWNAQSAMTSFVLLLTAIGTPWAVITMIAHVRWAAPTTRTRSRSTTAVPGAASTGTARAGTRGPP